MNIYCDKDGTAVINATIACPVCNTSMHGRVSEAFVTEDWDAPWNENEKLTVIPTICPACKFYGRIDICYA